MDTMLSQWIVPLAMVAIFYVAGWYFRLGTFKTRERRVTDLLVGLAVLAVVALIQPVIGPLSPRPERGVTLAISMALGVGFVVTYLSGNRRASFFFMMAFVAMNGIRAIAASDVEQPSWWFGTITLGAVVGALILKRWRTV